MRKYSVLTSISLFTVSFLLLNSCKSIPQGVTAVKPFDTNKYLGKWYEIARLDFKYERNLNNVTADYSLKDNGKIKVDNKGYNFKKKEWEQSIGKAKYAGMMEAFFFGTISGKVMEEAHCPVIVVPTDAAFDGLIDHIGVATNFSQDDAVLIEALRKFRDMMGSHLHVIHVDTTSNSEGQEQMKKFYEPWQNDKKMTCHCVVNKDINEGLEACMVEKKIDLLAILSQRRSWFDEIFEKNRAKEMSYQQSIPLMVFQLESLNTK